MEPADEDVAAHPAGEGQHTHRDVGERVAQIAATLTGYLHRRLAKQAQEHMDVVRGEAPERVLLRPNTAEVEAVGVHVLDLAEVAVGDERPKGLGGGMVLE